MQAKRQQEIPYTAPGTQCKEIPVDSLLTPHLPSATRTVHPLRLASKAPIDVLFTFPFFTFSTYIIIIIFLHYIFTPLGIFYGQVGEPLVPGTQRIEIF